ncbi:hypothetical protein PTH_1834 [Pelotomaculum thermopropionicum SI]|uniref:Uncharacterized protein n=1 Tax=Pelotomaculum thermopropionicum (strain DSM 13744 / JCM 10971 / SI) TaxID=370438 RepID=A5D156_PELTS|nr:hypothetical protein PTH_1834 [Pelotomaculum thermopropionicum SI]
MPNGRKRGKFEVSRVRRPVSQAGNVFIFCRRGRRRKRRWFVQRLQFPELRQLRAVVSFNLSFKKLFKAPLSFFAANCKKKESYGTP